MLTDFTMNFVWPDGRKRAIHFQTTLNIKATESGTMGLQTGESDHKRRKVKVEVTNGSLFDILTEQLDDVSILALMVQLRCYLDTWEYERFHRANAESAKRQGIFTVLGDRP